MNELINLLLPFRSHKIAEPSRRFQYFAATELSRVDDSTVHRLWNSQSIIHSVANLYSSIRCERIRGALWRWL